MSTTPSVARRSFFTTTRSALNRDRGSSGGRFGDGVVAIRDSAERRSADHGAGRGGNRSANRRPAGSSARSPVRRGGAAISSTANLPSAYFTAYDRPEYASGRIEWYRRNNYPSPTFGVGYGFNRVAARSTLGNGLYRGRNHDRGNHSLFGRRSSLSLGLSFNYNRGPRRFYSSYCAPARLSFSRYNYCGYRSSCGYSSWCYPRYGSTYLFSWGYPSYLWSDPGYGTSYGYDDYEPTYITNNYYADSGASDAASYVPSQGYYPPPQTIGNTTTTGQVSHQAVGLQAFHIGDYPLARREFVRAILANPDDPELIMLYGFAHFATGDYLVASLAIRRATEADPTLIDQPIDVAALYADRADFAAHLAALDDYVAKDAHDVDAKFLAGFVRYASGDPDGASAYFAECMAASPDDLVYFVLRDAALRAKVAQQAAERAAADAARSAEASKSAASSIDPE